MIKTYLFDFLEYSRGGTTYDASTKPREDSVKSFLESGAICLSPKYISFSGSRNNWVSYLKCLWNNTSLKLQFAMGCFNPKESIVFMQYPQYSLNSEIFKYVIKHFKQRGNKVIFFVHDLNMMRYKENYRDDLLFQLADMCILHSSKMVEECKKHKYEGPSVVLEFFDYRSDYEITCQTDLRNVKLIFAGNLNKSQFLANFCKENIFNKKFQMYLYGGSCDFALSHYVIYKGRFSPNKINEIEGNWGLVWDGESTETCNGIMGEYQMINAPFKFSLYIAANRPVIVWSKSATAEYVKKYHLGICVDSLKNIPTAITAITDDELLTIVTSVKEISKQIRTGTKLKNAINNAIELFANE